MDAKPCSKALAQKWVLVPKTSARLSMISHSRPTGSQPASQARSTAASVWPRRLSTPPYRWHSRLPPHY